MKNKVVLNRNFEGFRLSEKGLAKFKELAAQDPTSPYHTEEAFEEYSYDIQYGDMKWPNDSLEVVEIEGDKYDIIESEEYCEKIITPNTIRWTVIK